MSKEKVLEFAEGSLDRVLAFYDRQDVSLPYRPKFRYTGENPPDGRYDHFMGVLSNEETIRAETIHWHRNFSKVEFEILGITLSDKALEEDLKLTISLNIPKAYENEKRILSGADIFIFPNYEKYLSSGKQKELECFMAHEVWHLIEQNRNVSHIAPLIREGTAVRAESLFFGNDIAMPENPYLYDVIFYYGAASVVKESKRFFRNPYQEMLNPQICERIQEKLIERYEREISELLRRSLFDESYVKKRAKRQVEEPLQKSFLSNGLAPAGIVKTYRDAGAPTLARELEEQDLGRYVESLKLLHKCAAES